MMADQILMQAGSCYLLSTTSGTWRAQHL